MVTHFYDCYQILKKVYSDKTYLKQAINSVCINPTTKALTVKTCYGVLDKDIELSYYISKLTDKAPKLSIKIILKIAMYSIKYLQKHDYAVIDSAVTLVKKIGKNGVSGFVNATLRKFVKDNIELPTNENLKLSITYNYPLFAVNELIKDYGIEQAKSIMQSSNKLTTIRFADNIDGATYLNNLGVQFETTPYNNVFICKNFVRNEDFDKGLYTFQSIGSIAICNMIDGGDSLLDCCAAPGGKSVNLANKFNKVISTELHEHRCNLIKEYANRMNVKNVEVFNYDMTNYISEFENKFSAVLVDAPCSGYGVVNDNPDIKLNKDVNILKILNQTQLALLKNASKYVKVGGYLYYSTCSVFYKENIDVLNAFMSDINGFEIKEVNCKIPHLNVNDTIQLLPNISYGVGFYFAKLKRIK